MKLGTGIKNGNTLILVHFGRNWPPLWRHNRGSKCPKISFLTKIHHFSSNLNETWQKCWQWTNTNFGVFWPKLTPSMTSSGDTKTPKMSFLDPNRIFFNQSQWNLAQLLRMEKHKFWCILAEIDPLYDVIRGVKNAKNEFFGPDSEIIQPFSKKLGKAVKNGKAQILVYFGRNWFPLWRNNGGLKCPKFTFFDLNWPFCSQSQWNLTNMLRM